MTIAISVSTCYSRGWLVWRRPNRRFWDEESVAIADAIGDVAFPVDVKIIASERFEATKNIIGGIAYPALKYGRVLYAAA